MIFRVMQSSFKNLITSWSICVQEFVIMSLLLGSNKNVAMWINNIFLLVGTICSQRIMDRPVFPCVTVKIVIKAIRELTQREQRSIPILLVRWKLRRDHPVSWVSHVFDDSTVDITFLPINQAATSRMTHQPVVYVALNEHLSAESFPEWEVHGVVVCFI